MIWRQGGGPGYHNCAPGVSGIFLLYKPICILYTIYNLWKHGHKRQGLLIFQLSLGTGKLSHGERKVAADLESQTWLAKPGAGPAISDLEATEFLGFGCKEN